MERLIDLKVIVAQLVHTGDHRSVWNFLKNYAAGFGYSHLLALRSAMVTDDFVALKVLYADGAVEQLETGNIATLGEHHPILQRTRLSHVSYVRNRHRPQ
jgi:hypothetical protein